MPAIRDRPPVARSIGVGPRHAFRKGRPFRGLPVFAHFYVFSLLKKSILLFTCAVAPLASLEAEVHTHSHSHSHGHSHCNETHRKPIGWFNPEIEVAVDLITSWSRRANQWNFTPRDLELIVHSDLGPYAQIYGIVNAGTELAPTEDLRPFDVSHPRVEELALVFDRLPWGLEVKAGQFFADFTMLGKLHGHELPFVDRPLSLDAIVGGETRARGLELSWTPPSARQVRLTAGLVNRIGAEPPITSLLETGEDEEVGAFSQRDNGLFRSLTGYGRAATELKLSASSKLEIGVDYAQGSGEGTRRIATGDIKFSWQPNPEKDDLFETGGELLWSQQRGRFSKDARVAGGPEYGTASATGGYVFAQYRIGERWQPGVRFDCLRSNTFESDEQTRLSRNDTWTTSAYLTCKLNENHRLRWQVNHVDARHEIVAGKGNRDWQVFFQWTVLWGAR